MSYQPQKTEKMFELANRSLIKKILYGAPFVEQDVKFPIQGEVFVPQKAVFPVQLAKLATHPPLLATQKLVFAPQTETSMAQALKSTGQTLAPPKQGGPIRSPPSFESLYMLPIYSLIRSTSFTAKGKGMFFIICYYSVYCKPFEKLARVKCRKNLASFLYNIPKNVRYF